MSHRRKAIALWLLITLSFADCSSFTAEAGTFRPVVRGKRGAVAGGNSLALEAGLRMLEAGGNAVDAGVATILAASVVEFSHFSFGGEAAVLIKLKDQRVVVIEGQGPAPAMATREFFADRPPPAAIPATGPLPATVPAILDACVTALDLFGTKTLSEVLQPAIELADGFPLDEVLVYYIRTRSAVFSKWPDARRVFLPGGDTPKVGDMFVQADLARTLREIIRAERAAARGTPDDRHAGLMAARDYFYRGPIAQRIGDYMQANGGLLTADDFARFQAKVGEPVTTEYRGYQVYKPGFWTQGPALIETLNLLEGFDLKKMGHNSAAYIHTVTEALKLGFADRDHYYGDPDFVRIPAAELMSKSYASLRRPLIDASRASLALRPGDPAHRKAVLSSGVKTSRRLSSVPPHERAQDTTCVNVVDRDGNLFSATPSGAWLPAVVAGDTGVLMSERLQSSVLDANSPNVVAPGKRPRVTLSPTLVLKAGQPFMVLSTPGGDSQDQALLQTLLNILEFGMNPQEAVEAPRFDTQHYVNSFEHEFLPGTLSVESRVNPRIIQALKNRGHKITVLSEWGSPSAPTVILYNTTNGVTSAGADPRRGRYAVVW
jgi:gamma-glutamyltranspeptidase/glutathione hydrolase